MRFAPLLAASLLGYALHGAAAPALAAPEALTPKSAVERALSRNRTIQQQRLFLESAEIGYDSAWDTMFLPSVSLNLSTTSERTIGKIPGAPEPAPGLGTESRGYPASNATLTLGSYTLFNFWKDWIVYEKARLDWRRQQELYSEGVRAIRFQVLTALLRFKIEQEKLDASRRSVTIAQAILGLVRSRVKLRQAAESDVSSSQLDLLTAENAQSAQETSAKAANWDLNLLLGDPVGTHYLVRETTRYAPLKMNVDEATRIYLAQSPSTKGARSELKKAELELELQEKNRLPLPTVSFSGVNVSYLNGYYGASRDVYGSLPGNTNFNLSAAVTLTVPILGPGGLFSHRQVAQARVSRDLAELTFEDTVQRDKVAIHQALTSLRQLEELIQNNKESFEKSSALLDALFSNLSSRTVSRLELRDAIQQARDAELALLDAELQHLATKFSLAALIGVNGLAGEVY